MNKNILLIFSVILSSILILNFVSAELSIPNKTSTINIFLGGSASGYFTLKNTGLENITNISFRESLPSGITILYDPTNLSTLEPNNTKRINFTLNANSNAGLGQKIITIYIDGQNSTSNISTSFSFKLNVKKSYCELGNQGSKLRIDIDEPDDDDTFYVGKNITISLNVENRDNDEIDFVIETELFDIASGESIAEDSLEGSLDEDEDDDYELKLKIPYNADSGNYLINIKVYEEGNEEEQCVQDSININIKRRSHELVIDKKTYNSVLSCGSPLGLNLKIANAGKNDEEDVKVIVSNSVLNFSSEQIKDIDEGDYENYYFNDILPIVEPGTYTFSISVYYEGDKLQDTIDLTLRDNCLVQRKDVSIILTQQGTASIDKNSVVKATITNTGSVALMYSISVSDYQSWGSLISIEPSTLNLGAGQSADVFITFKPNQNASSINTFNIKVSYDSSSKTQSGTLSLISGQITKAASFWDQLKFEFKRSPWLIIVNIILIIVVILLIIIAIKPRKKAIVKEERKNNKNNNKGREPKEARLRKRGQNR